MSRVLDERALVAVVVGCFLVVIVVAIASARPAIALAYSGLGIAVLALHGVAAASRARVPLFVASTVASLAAIALMLNLHIA